MNIIINIYNFLRGLNKNTIIFILGALFMLLFLKQCNQTADLKRQLANAKTEAERSHNNYLASQDSVKYYKTEAGSLVAEKRSFVLQLEEFENNYKDLKREYSEVLGLNKNLSYGKVKGQDGYNYATIKIGTQEWMAENLKTSIYANGDPMAIVQNNLGLVGCHLESQAHWYTKTLCSTNYSISAHLTRRC